MSRHGNMVPRRVVNRDLSDIKIKMLKLKLAEKKNTIIEQNEMFSDDRRTFGVIYIYQKI